MNRLTEHFFHSPTQVFSQPEVAVAVEGSEFSRHGLVKRAIANGEILNIRRGLYCLAPRYRKRPVNVYAVSQLVYGPSYVSLEAALSYHGWIPEAVHACTCASLGNAKEFQTPLGIFSYRRVPQRAFFAEVERCLDSAGNVFFMASPVKALTDYVYTHRLWWDIGDACSSLRIEPEEIAAATVSQLDVLLVNYTNRRLQRFLTSWKEALSR